MKLKQKITLILTAASLVYAAVAVPWAVLIAYLSPAPDSIETHMRQVTSGELVGAIVYVQQGQQMGEIYVSGLNNKQQQTPVEGDLLFKIASIAKLFKAVSVTQLVEQGRLRLDATLAEYLPALAPRIENSEQITVRMLVSHRSGIPNYMDQTDYNWAEPQTTTDQLIGLIEDVPASFKPGADYEYSNTNYLLLHEIIERVSGQSYAGYVRQHILQPLSLNNTFFSIEEAGLPRLMSGYTLEYPLDIKAVDYGGMIASIEDTGRFLRALNDGTLLGDTAQQIYLQLYPLNHTGLLPGYSSIARYHPDIDSVVIQFINTSGDQSWQLTEVYYERLVDLLRDQSSQ